jgi:hypothetical protein
VAVVPVRAFAVDEFVAFLVPPERAALAFSTMLERTLVALAVDPVPLDFNGDPGRLRYDLVGDPALSRFTSREFEEVGERTCAGRTGPLSAVAPRGRFFVPSFSTSFSLSPVNSLGLVSISAAPVSMLRLRTSCVGAFCQLGGRGYWPLSARERPLPGQAVALGSAPD